MSASRLTKLFAVKKILMVTVSYVDLAGVTRSKPLVGADIGTVIKEGFKIARANLAMNMVAPHTPGTRLDISQGDVSIVPDPDTLVFPSYAPGAARFIGNVHEADGRVSSYCPRSSLKRVLASCSSWGYSPVVGLESEFHLVRFQGERVVPADSSAIQSLDGFNQHRQLLEEIVRTLPTVNVRPVKVHAEGGRGQMEIDIGHEPALKAADGYVYFKEVVRTLSRDHGLIASFMPKIGADWWGSGLHAHISLLDSKAKNLFPDKGDTRGLGLSGLCYHFIGGILKHARALSAIAAPTVNSYKRLLPGRWNADAIAYGPGNRGAAIRVPDERGSSTRIEVRIPDNTCNIYLMIASVVAAGMDGIEKRLEPGQPLTFDASQMTDRERVSRGLELMPRSLGEALSELERDTLLRKALGPELLEEFIAQRSFEASQAADQVTQWEVSHFLDLF